ncbi:TIM barrel protein [Streptomyces sp. NBC_00481]|uniref:TIM barrel protein n=1 Tax=Streptomyces sp. NBC_00481 TaxID=2975755 RepID=UPI002DDB4F1D|nr:TIM barrel protein [Streptomyces sp. NBC_00481]WRY94037.1 TIM barrel protein [Streptomyces sp. NBC_00481]
MIDFSACIELMFLEGDRPLDDRVRAAADSGFRAVEIWDWWDKDLPRLTRALETTGTRLITLCVESWKDKCDLGDPSSHDEFLARVRAAADAARRTNTPRLVVLAGDVAPEIEPATQLHHAVAVLARAGEEVGRDGLELLVEVVNREHEGPNALISDSRSALSLLRAIDLPNIRFLYDRYHAILNGEPLGAEIEDAIPLIGHVQAADIPGRHEFGTGTIDWAAELAWLQNAGYDGYVGIEATPLGDSSLVYATARALL